MSQPTIKTPFLITSKEWPVDPDLLRQELTKSYTEIAFATNTRTIGIYDKFEVVTGNQWYNTANPAKRQQSYRQAYSLDSATIANNPNPISHGLSNLSRFLLIFGTAITDTGNYIPLPYASASADKNIELLVTNSNINIILGSSSPSLNTINIVLEYLLKS